MFDSEIHINAGSSLILEDNVTFLAKNGICKLVIDGNISIGANVSFLAEEGAKLHLELNNLEQTLVINNATFEGAVILSDIIDLTIYKLRFY